MINLTVTQSLVIKYNFNELLVAAYYLITLLPNSVVLFPPPIYGGGYVFGAVCLSVCLSVCPSDYSQTCERILTKFFGRVGHGSRTK